MLKWVPIRVWASTYRKIRLMAALYNMPLGRVVDTVVGEAFEKTGIVLEDEPTEIAP